MLIKRILVDFFYFVKTCRLKSVPPALETKNFFVCYSHLFKALVPWTCASTQMQCGFFCKMMPSKYYSFLSHVSKNVIFKFIFPCRMSFCSIFHDPDYTHTILNFTIQPPTGEAWTKTENCSTFQVCCVPPRMLSEIILSLSLYTFHLLFDTKQSKKIYKVGTILTQ